jgi:nicotinamide-nucleotide amidase
MGPGADDIARDCLAATAGVGTSIAAEARNFLAASYRRLVAKGVVEDAELTAERLRMATVPEGSTVYENTGGTAPVVELQVSGTTFFLLPGQPEELRRLFVQVVQPRLEQDGPGGLREVVHVDYPGGDESLVSRLLGDLTRRHPAVHGRARLQGTEDDLAIRITLSVEGTDRADLHAQLTAATADLRARLGLEVPRGSSTSTGG